MEITHKPKEKGLINFLSMTTSCSCYMSSLTCELSFYQLFQSHLHSSHTDEGATWDDSHVAIT